MYIRTALLSDLQSKILPPFCDSPICVSLIDPASQDDSSIITSDNQTATHSSVDQFTVPSPVNPITIDLSLIENPTRPYWTCLAVKPKEPVPTHGLMKIEALHLELKQAQSELIKEPPESREKYEAERTEKEAQKWEALAKQQEKEAGARAGEVERAKKVMTEVYDALLHSYKKKDQLKDISYAFGLDHLGTIEELKTWIQAHMSSTPDLQNDKCFVGLFAKRKTGAQKRGKGRLGWLVLIMNQKTGMMKGVRVTPATTMTPTVSITLHCT
ncbi:hypothetical protein M422DRAFT_250764 [Sphaerobolus stellatus SS14]|uniref:Unplaced genomic scaffold SPHSTscaffold_36, whole genome shotgun sequence n=1 Tax=Sphaerobolus stellatus (strain SS14) TaxID=990650 RepID=A0A0C9URF9_SPHS4|nr:hypothetical protein M422DRAFT_250764 [Sphaerobolus stellatus SS14]